jgi:hypothetical protein
MAEPMLQPPNLSRDPKDFAMNMLLIQDFLSVLSNGQVRSDGFPPVGSPTPTLKLLADKSLLAKWDPVIDPDGYSNADPVTYDIHISTSSGFTPDDATTLVGAVRGTNFVIRHLPDGTDLTNGTTYYVRIVARDEDGAAAPGSQASSAPQPGGGAAAADHTHAGAGQGGALGAGVVADAMIASVAPGKIQSGQLGSDVELAAGGKVRTKPPTGKTVLAELGGEVGFPVRVGDDVSDAFHVDEDGSLYVRGRVDWGTTSKLLPADIMELTKQGMSGFSSPQRVQRKAATGTAASFTVTFAQPTSVGSLLLLTVATSESGGTAPSVTTPSGWTFVDSQLSADSDIRITVFKIENSPISRSSVAVTLTSAPGDNYRYFFEEWSGVDVEDKRAKATGVSSTLSTGTTVTTAQADEFWWVAGAVEVGAAAQFSNPDDPWSSPWVIGSSPNVVWAATGYRTASAIGTANATIALTTSGSWVGIVMTFKSKATTVVDTPEIGAIRLYSKDLAGVARLYYKDDAGVEHGPL